VVFDDLVDDGAHHLLHLVGVRGAQVVADDLLRGVFVLRPVLVGNVLGLVLIGVGACNGDYSAGK
jgi:hypothetical protein